MKPVHYCRMCNQRLDEYWVGLGVTVHPSCEDNACEHGEPRGVRYCALCRRTASTVGPAPTRPPVDRQVAPVGHRHPPTSHAAAQRVLPSTGTKRRMTYDLISASPDGLCDWELEAAFNWKHESASACRRSLVKDGWLIDSGRTRPVPDTGNAAIVWIAEEAP